MRGLLLWRLGGERLASIRHRALGLPAVNMLRRHTVISPLIVSPGQPTLKEVSENVKSSFGPTAGVLKEKKVVHQILMFDEIKVEERPRWCARTNNILGICREHGSRVGLQFTAKEDVEVLLENVKSGSIHLAVEVSAH